MDRNLIDYLPPIFREYAEFQALMGAEQVEAERLWNAADLAARDFFLSELTQNGIERWESILQIIAGRAQSAHSSKVERAASFYAAHVARSAASSLWTWKLCDSAYAECISA